MIMPVSGIHSGQQIMQLSHKMADKAAHEIQQTFVKGGEDLSFNKVELAKNVAFAANPSLAAHATVIEPLIEVTQAASYNRIGASVVEKNNEVIGSLLDIHV
ncbi:hypothetical protein D3Z63_16430 [Vibrio parahaemolyticus]|uniref:Uncharacterized protein n=3 Tax=Vibrio TaxID=662 RepID=A0A249VZ79_VIBPH|nr:hypothetical protein FORC8_3544 [Vibrio parahaemolyticus]QGG35626.1 hypothetical protein GH799_21350 [Vibrio parahaemolyticus 10329]APU75879.1 hypothetical protein BMI84_17840 [Vibrio parahaemolyticus]ASZ49639.1 hypothetical protein YA91_03225 [Vibrio parahaemolyticus]AUT89157.1 hypothetical protein RK51_020560 [Vibrio parahaemolyticus]